jgi:hypothetical protein
LQLGWLGLLDTPVLGHASRITPGWHCRCVADVPLAVLRWWEGALSL